jgi:DNA-binding FrmR family transcriptional regulator
MVAPRMSKSYAADRASPIGWPSKIEGQLRGIPRMVEDDRYYVDVLQSIASLRSAVDAVAGILLEKYIRGCVAHGIRSDEGDAHIDEVMEVIRLYVRSQGGRTAVVERHAAAVGRRGAGRWGKAPQLFPALPDSVRHLASVNIALGSPLSGHVIAEVG